MRVIVNEDTQVWINGKLYQVEEGEQELEDPVAEVLLHAGKAKKVEKEKRKDKNDNS